MRYKVQKSLPRAEDIIKAFPVSEKTLGRIAKDRREIKDILSGKDKRKLVIVGPCSAWPYAAVIKYAKRLKKISDRVDDKLKLVLRLYIQKPRTTKGWLGPVNQPNPFENPDIEAGAYYARKLMVEVNEIGLPIADEAVFTHNAKGFIELLSWLAIGARSTEDQEHRIFASAVECPVGMKNPTSGQIEIGVNSVLVAQHPHTAVFDEMQVNTGGNPYAHLVLRGGLERPNYHLEDLCKAKELMEKAKVKNPAILIDASHDNCKLNGVKNPLQQIHVVREVMSTLALYPELNNFVKGFMLESFIKQGSQNIGEKTKDDVDLEGLSITDPCLSWEQTESLILEIAK
ncbi:MAG: 3-deoxy-7-phosphoheptulonate synthase [Candidatus Gracilibacteria bacterium]